MNLMICLTPAEWASVSKTNVCFIHSEIKRKWRTSTKVKDPECVYHMESVAKAAGNAVWSVKILRTLSKIIVASSGFGVGIAVHFCDFMARMKGGNEKVGKLFGMQILI